GVWSPQGMWIGTSGTAAQGQDRPITIADHTRVGSITKTFTVTALLQQVQAGTLSLDDPIEKYVPGMPNGKTATLRNLATMTSGIPSYTENKKFTDQFFANPDSVWLPQQLVDVVKGQKPMFAAGTKFYYSNTNTVLLGMAIQNVTGKPIENVFQQGIFVPLGLTGTSFPGVSAALPSPYLSGVTEQGNPEGTVKDATNWNPSWGFTAGEIISTLNDLHTWAIALATGRGVLNDATQKIRLESLNTTVPPNTAQKAYGLGFGIVNGWIGHTGELPGYNTVINYNPKTETAVVVMVNSDIAKGKLNPAPAVFDAIAPIITPSN
ncbi:MAG: serine hydrolase domain-containing protein, partial [Actinomycetes bacterium]